MENLNAEAREQILASLEWYRVVSSKIGSCTVDKLEIEAYVRLIKELTEENEKLTINMNAYGLTAKRLGEENERLMRDKTALECVVSTARNQAKADTVRKVITLVKERSLRNAYSCMISGEFRETYTIKGFVLDEIEKEVVGE